MSSQDFLLPSDTTNREEDPVGDVPDEGPGEEANAEGTEPNIAPTPGHAGGPQPLTTAIDHSHQSTISPIYQPKW